MSSSPADCRHAWLPPKQKPTVTTGRSGEVRPRRYSTAAAVSASTPAGVVCGMWLRPFKSSPRGPFLASPADGPDGGLRPKQHANVAAGGAGGGGGRRD